MADIPLDIILTWPKPNYEDPETHNKGFLAGSVILAAVASLTVALRLWARYVIARKLAIEDYFLLFALVSFRTPFIRAADSTLTFCELAFLSRSFCFFQLMFVMPRLGSEGSYFDDLQWFTNFMATVTPGMCDQMCFLTIFLSVSDLLSIEDIANSHIRCSG